jgi:PAS domain S-box-containing protein
MELPELQSTIDAFQQTTALLLQKASQLSPEDRDRILAAARCIEQQLGMTLIPASPPLPKTGPLSIQGHQYKALLQSVFEADPGALAVVSGTELVVVFANPVFRYLFPGHNPLGQAYAALWGPDHENGFALQVAGVLANGRPFIRQDFEYRFPDGNQRIFTFQVRRIDWDRHPAALVILWDTTELHQAQQTLNAVRQEAERSLEQLQAVMDNINDGLFVTDSTGKLLFANRAMLALSGLPQSPQESVRAYTTRIEVSDEQGNPVPYEQLPLPRALRGEAVHDVAFTVAHIDTGKKYTALYNTAIIQSKGGEPGLIVMTVRDITDKIAAERAIRESERRLAEFFENTHDSFFALDHDWRYVYVNQRSAEMIGLEPREILGKKLWELMPLTSGTLIEQQIRKAMQERLAVHFETPGAYSSNWYEISAYPTHEGLAVFAIDRTEEHRAKAQLEERNRALNENRTRLQAILEGIPDAIFLKDLDGHLLLANPATLKIIDRNVDQAIGKTDLDLYSNPLVAETIIENDRRVLASGQTQVMEERVLAPGDPPENERIYLSTKTPFRDEDGNIIGLLGIARDITINKKNEKQLRRLNRSLQVLNHINQKLIRAHSEPELLQAVCEIITKDCGYSLVWIGFAEQDAAKTLRPVASAGFDEGYLDSLSITWADSEFGRGPSGTAIRTGKPEMCQDIRTDPHFTPWREDAVRRGYASSLSLPLLASGKAFGTINIYSKEVDGFRNEEIGLLSELASDLAYGITMLRAQAAHNHAEAARSQSEQRYRSLFEYINEGFALHEVIFNEQGEPVDYRFLDVNPAFERLTGLACADIRGRRKSELPLLANRIPDRPEVFYQVALTGEPARFEVHVPAMNASFEVIAYQPANDQFAVLFVQAVR